MHVVTPADEREWPRSATRASRRVVFVTVVVCVAACGSRGEAPKAAGADSIAASTDSVHSDSNVIIGHDSAFGPLFAVDSTGKLVDLPRRGP